MSVKSSISLTKPQDRFARSLVETGQYSSLSAVLQQGLELLRQKREAEELEIAALRELINRRAEGPVISDHDMRSRLDHMVTQKRPITDVEN